MSFGQPSGCADQLLYPPGIRNILQDMFSDMIEPTLLHHALSERRRTGMSVRPPYGLRRVQHRVSNAEAFLEYECM